VPKGFLVEEDIGLLRGNTIASTACRSKEMVKLQRKIVDIILADPGGGPGQFQRRRGGRVSIPPTAAKLSVTLKPLKNAAPARPR
jgi:hypothetical protein